MIQQLVSQTRHISTLAIFGLCTAASPIATAESPRITVGVVVDGPAEEWNKVGAYFSAELEALAETEFTVRFPSEKRLDGNWSTVRIDEALKRLEADPEVDLVLALGFASSQIAATHQQSKKPVFAPFVTDVSLAGLSQQKGTSGIRNLNYLSSELLFNEQLKTFLRSVPFTRLAILIDATLYEAIESVRTIAVDQARRVGVEIDFILHQGETDLISKIPAHTQAVMVAPMPRLTRSGWQSLIRSLIARRLPSFSLMGNEEVKEGILMSAWSAADVQRLARQSALNMQAVMRGETAGAQTVLFERRRLITLNMATARALGLSPRFEILREAVLLNEDEAEGPALRWKQAAEEAVRANLDLIAGQLSVQADAHGVAAVRSVLFPQVEANVDAFRRRREFPLVAGGATPERSTEGSLTLRQIVFSERTLADLSIQQKLHGARQAQQRSLELDVVQAAATAFLNVLIARTQLDIQQNNLRLAQTNWQLAKDRVDVGRADVSDVYRWESEIANAKQNVLVAKSRIEQTRDQLNALLHRPLESRYPLEPATLQDPSLLISRKELLQLIDSERAFRDLIRFFINEGLSLSPEMAAIDRQIAAESRHLRSERWGSWMPELSVAGIGSRVLEDRWAPTASLDLEGETDWQLRANASLPLFEGGGSHARASQAALTLSSLRAQREALRERIAQNIRASLHALRASHPAIELSAQSAQAAGKTFELIRKHYVRGTRSVVELLDAQNASLAADQAAANAVYAALTDLMSLQRAIGQFDFFMDDAGRDRMMQRLASQVAPVTKERDR